MTRAEATAALLAKGLTPCGLTRAEAAAYLGMSPRTFRRRLKEGRLPAANPATGTWEVATLARLMGRGPSKDTLRDAIDATIDAL